MLKDIITNIITTAIFAFLGFMLQVVVKSMNEREKNENLHSQIKHSRTLVKKQFFICFISLPIFVAIGVLILAPLSPKTVMDFLFMSAKVVCFLVAFYAFIFAWGAFSAAFEFYPKDEILNSESNSPDNTRPDEPVKVPTDDCPEKAADD